MYKKNNEELFMHSSKEELISSNYSKCHNLIKNNNKSIRPDLIKIGFENNIINKAEEFHSRNMLETRRGRRRKQTIFYYVLAAYNALRIPIEPKKIALRCGIKPSEISKAISRCSDNNDPNIPKIVIYQPEDFIVPCFNQLQSALETNIKLPENSINDIQKMATEILSINKQLRDQRPQTVAIAIIKYYLDIIGIKYEHKLYANIFDGHDTQLKKIYNMVEEAFNNC